MTKYADEEDDKYELNQQRVRNRLLASRVRKLQKSGDETFAALCETGSAQAALYSIWEAADLSCDAQDYDEIVQYVTTAIAAYRASHLSQE